MRVATNGASIVAVTASVIQDLVFDEHTEHNRLLTTYLYLVLTIVSNIFYRLYLYIGLTSKGN